VLIERARYLQSRFRVADETQQVTDRLLILIERFPVGGKQIHDAAIVATMQAHGIRGLLTATPADFRRYGDLISLQSP